MAQRASGLRSGRARGQCERGRGDVEEGRRRDYVDQRARNRMPKCAVDKSEMIGFDADESACTTEG